MANWLYAIVDGSLTEALKRLAGNAHPDNRPFTYKDLQAAGRDSVTVLKTAPGEYELKLLPLGATSLWWRLATKNAEPGTLLAFERLLAEHTEDAAPWPSTSSPGRLHNSAPKACSWQCSESR